MACLRACGTIDGCSRRSHRRWDASRQELPLLHRLPIRAQSEPEIPLAVKLDSLYRPNGNAATTERSFICVGALLQYVRDKEQQICEKNRRKRHWLDLFIFGTVYRRRGFCELENKRLELNLFIQGKNHPANVSRKIQVCIDTIYYIIISLSHPDNVPFILFRESPFLPLFLKSHLLITFFNTTFSSATVGDAILQPSLLPLFLDISRLVARRFARTLSPAATTGCSGQ